MEHKMGLITLEVGVFLSGDNPADLRRPVLFVGERLVRIRLPRGGALSEYRTLYKMEDGRFLVHIEEIPVCESRSWIRIATPADLDVGGRFELLGYNAGLSRPLTVDEALKSQEEG